MDGSTTNANSAPNNRASVVGTTFQPDAVVCTSISRRVPSDRARRPVGVHKAPIAVCRDTITDPIGLCLSFRDATKRAYVDIRLDGYNRCGDRFHRCAR
jgi:hypothetical protein